MVLGFTPIQIASSVVLLFGSAFLLIGTVTSYWNYFHMQMETKGVVRALNLTGQGHRGLIWACHNDFTSMDSGAQSCSSRFKDYSEMQFQKNPMINLSSLNYQGWEMATLVMLCLSVAFGFGALFLAPLCCHKCGLIHSVFVYLAALMAIIGMAVYLVNQLGSAMSQTTQYMKFDKFGWSFYISIFGVLFQLVAAVLYSVGACCCKGEEGYQKGTRTQV